MPEGRENRVHSLPQDADSGRFTTLPPRPRRGGDAYLYLGLGIPSVVSASQKAEAAARPGDLLLLDTLCPEYLARDDRAVFFRIPCAYLGITLGEVRHLTGVRVGAARGVGALASRFLRALCDSEARRSASGKRLALNAVDLVALMVEDLLGPHRSVSSAT